jgi:hypothetical protein
MEGTIAIYIAEEIKCRVDAELEVHVHYFETHCFCWHCTYILSRPCTFVPHNLFSANKLVFL